MNNAPAFTAATLPLVTAGELERGLEVAPRLLSEARERGDGPGAPLSRVAATRAGKVFGGDGIVGPSDSFSFAMML